MKECIQDLFTFLNFTQIQSENIVDTDNLFQERTGQDNHCGCGMADNGSQQSGGSGNKCQQVQDGQPSARSKVRL